MNSSATPFGLPDTAPELARRFAVIMAGLGALVARRFIRMPHLVGFTLLLWGRLNRAVRRFHRALTVPAKVWVLRVRADACGNGVALYDNLTSGGLTRLFDGAGQPFLLPQAFALLPGSELAVFAFTDTEISSDVPTTCRSNSLEVILAALLVVPVASDPDRNGNLLIDSWEAQFFGGLPSGPFTDADGDGYQNLQEMLAGTDPEDGNSIPAVPPVTFARPMMHARRLTNGFVALRWTWPAQYAGSFFFGLREADNVLLPFSEIAVAFSIDGDEFTVIVPPAAALRFYNLVVRLR